METHETPGDYWRLMIIILMGIPESKVYYSGIMRILIQIKNKGTHETQKDYCGLMRYMRVIVTPGDS